jgi:hypothetical protein
MKGACLKSRFNLGYKRIFKLKRWYILVPPCNQQGKFHLPLFIGLRYRNFSGNCLATNAIAFTLNL